MMTDDKPTFGIYYDGWTEHDAHNSDCSSCWSGFPKLCANCGGLVHAQFGEESRDGYTLIKKCDGCGDDWGYDD